MKSEELADYILQKAHVGVLDGVSFGKYGEGHLRLSYANSIENIDRALARIGKALKDLKK